MKLAQVAQPLGTLKVGAVRGFAAGLRHVATTESELGEIEKRYPGFTEEAIKRGSPIMEREIVRLAPDLWKRMADIYVVELSDDELAGYIAFYGAPTGSKLMRLINEKADVSRLVNSMGQAGELSAEAHVKAVEGAAAASISSLSAEELVAIMTFNAQNASTNKRVAPKIMAAVTDWQKGIDDGPMSKEIGEVMVALIKEMSSKDAPKS